MNSPSTPESQVQLPLALRIFSHLTPQVLVAIAIGVTLGYFLPDTAKQMQPLGDAFISLVKMVIGPVVFLTVVLGVASMGDLGRLGRTGLKTIIYFEIVTTIALLIGLAVVNWQQPGAGLDRNKVLTKDAMAKTEKYLKPKDAAGSANESMLDHCLKLVIPQSVVKPFVEGETLQIVFIALLVGVALAGMGQAGQPIIAGCDQLCHLSFRVVNMVMRVAPIGAFGAMAYTVGNAGVESLLPLAKLMACVYLTMALFIFVVLGAICAYWRFNIFKLLFYIRDELLLVLGTSSSESALPRLMAKLQRAGCSKKIVELVIPAGYSFNLDGTSIYLSMATIFIAQAYGMSLTWQEQLEIMAILMLTSKGAAGVTGAGFIVLASTIQATSLRPVAEGIALLFGVDRFMSEARSITNIIGNAVAAMVIAKSEGEFDEAQWQRAQAGLHEELDVPDLDLEDEGKVEPSTP